MPQQPVDPHQLIDQVTESLRATSEEVVPWFIEQMPLMLQDMAPRTSSPAGHHRRPGLRTAHRADPRSEDGSGAPRCVPSTTWACWRNSCRSCPRTSPSHRIHTASDGSLVIDTFEFGETPRFDADDPAQREKLESTLQYAAEHLPEWDPEEVRDYFHRCNGDYVLTLTPLRMCSHWRLFQEVTGTDGTAVALEKEKADVNLSRIVVAASNASRRSMLERVAQLLSCSSINIHRAYLDTVDDGENGSTSILGFVVQNKDGHAIDPDGDAWDNVRRELLRIKWVDAAAIDLDRRHPQLDLTSAELIIALCSLSHQVLVKRNPYAFTMDRIRRLAESNIEITTTITDLMQQRFNPAHPLPDSDFWTSVRRLKQRINDETDLQDARTILDCMLDAVAATLKTNLFLEDRYALSMRIDPQFMDTDQRPATPFGVFFVHGRGFNGFHVRFRDIARGGVRVVVTRGLAQFNAETERLYDEAYGLAFAQQMKNKDIPEGGSKAAVLLHPRSKVDRSTKAFVDSILDHPGSTRAGSSIARPRGTALLRARRERDPRLIDWIVDRIDTDTMPTALMSSKPARNQPRSTASRAKACASSSTWACGPSASTPRPTPSASR